MHQINGRSEKITRFGSSNPRVTRDESSSDRETRNNTERNGGRLSSSHQNSRSSGRESDGGNRESSINRESRESRDNRESGRRIVFRRSFDSEKPSSRSADKQTSRSFEKNSNVQHRNEYDIDKAISLFRSKGFEPIKFYIIKDDRYQYFGYVEIRHVSEGTFFLVDITKYHISYERRRYNQFEKILSENNLPIFTLIRVEIADKDLNNDKYIANIYEEIKDTDLNDVPSEEKIMSLYQRDIGVSDEDTKNIEKVKLLYRQTLRLGQCMSNLSYQLVLLDSQFDNMMMGAFTVTSRENVGKIFCYLMKSNSRENQKTFNIVMGIDLFFTNDSEITCNDIHNIKIKLCHLLNTNHAEQSSKLKKMIDKQGNIVKKNEQIIAMKKDKINKIENINKILAECRNRDISKLQPEQVTTLKEIKTKAIVQKRDLLNQLGEITLKTESIVFESLLMIIKLEENFNKLDQIKLQ